MDGEIAMIAAMIGIYLYTLVFTWCFFKYCEHYEAIHLFDFKRWICGHSRSADIAKGVTGFSSLLAGLMLVGWMESLA
jgi:hypothetical protein